ncbi:MAG: protealysin inhibitor emfourin [Thermoanaerobaculia bacterium]
MKVTLAKHGGLAAGMRRPPLKVDSTELPGAAAAELERLVASAKAAPAGQEERPGRARDAMSYTITVEEDDGAEPTVLRHSDVSESAALSALLEWLESHPERR